MARQARPQAAAGGAIATGWELGLGLGIRSWGSQEESETDAVDVRGKSAQTAAVTNRNAQRQRQPGRDLAPKPGLLQTVTQAKRRASRRSRRQAMRQKHSYLQLLSRAPLPIHIANCHQLPPIHSLNTSQTPLMTTPTSSHQRLPPWHKSTQGLLSIRRQHWKISIP
jgi:hypothetical protein